MNAGEALVGISRDLAAAVDRIEVGPPIAYVYNPLVYARDPHEKYLRCFGTTPKKVLLLGMNPGPFGMAQTGIPFGDVAMVRDWMGITGAVQRPTREHPKRPVRGFDFARSEVSGARLWGWARARFGTAERFFRDFFVVNYCPLAFMDEAGRNCTPDKLPARERGPLIETCDEALRKIVTILGPTHVVGVGGFAEQRARAALGHLGVTFGCVLHPSPASPKANRGWSEAVERDLGSLGISLPSVEARAINPPGLNF